MGSSDMPEKRNIVRTGINRRAANAAKKKRITKQGRGFEDSLTGKKFGYPVTKQFPLRNLLGTRILEDLVSIGVDPDEALNLVKDLGDLDDLDPHTRLKVFMSKTTLPPPKTLIDDALGQPGPTQSRSQVRQGQSFIKAQDTADLKTRKKLLTDVKKTGLLAYRQQNELQKITDKLDEVPLTDTADIKAARRSNRLDQETLKQMGFTDDIRRVESSPYMGPAASENLDNSPLSNNPLKQTPASRFNAVRRGSTLVVEQGPNTFIVEPDKSGKGLKISRQFFKRSKDIQGNPISTAGSFSEDLVALTKDQKSNFIKALASKQIEETTDFQRKSAIKAAISTKAKRVAAFERLEASGKPFGTVSSGIRTAGMTAVAKGDLSSEGVDSVRVGGQRVTPRDLATISEKNIGRGGNYRNTKADMMRAARSLSRKGGPAALIALAVLLGGGAMVGGSSDSA
tara:strand:- start:11576 stop:12940 length:1365 start_codon:yes stop_codon:yes gene_type:complete